jgi:hypothetical protein
MKWRIRKTPRGDEIEAFTCSNFPFKVDGVQELLLSLYSNEEPSYEGKRTWMC